MYIVKIRVFSEVRGINITANWSGIKHHTKEEAIKELKEVPKEYEYVWIMETA